MAIYIIEIFTPIRLKWRHDFRIEILNFSRKIWRERVVKSCDLSDRGTEGNDILWLNLRLFTYAHNSNEKEWNFFPRVSLKDFVYTRVDLSLFSYVPFACSVVHSELNSIPRARVNNTWGTVRLNVQICAVFSLAGIVGTLTAPRASLLTIPIRLLLKR